MPKMLATLTPGVSPDSLGRLFPEVGFPTALAPMQDVTGLPFMNLIAGFGPPDLFFTEYFRVHASARIDPGILSSITENKSGKPVFAQLIGEDLEHVARFARELQEYCIAGIDLNLGCPAPRVYRKNVGGGLLRDPDRIDRVLNVLRDTCSCPLTVKTRIGFEDHQNFGRLLKVFAQNEVELVSLHARTVKGGYRETPQYDYVKQAVTEMDCPVLLNGDVHTARSAMKLVNETGAKGVMIGRSAIRNPWIFKQIRQLQNGEEMDRPTLGDVHLYINQLCDVLSKDTMTDEKQVARMKKFLNYIGLSVDLKGEFLFQMRRTRTRSELDRVCQYFLLDNGRSEQPMHLEPLSDIISRPRETGSPC